MGELVEWVKGIVCWLIITSMILQCVPGKVYRPYLRLYMGMVLIITVLTPFSRWDGTTEELAAILDDLAFEEILPEWEDEMANNSVWNEMIGGGE